jgi:phosphohistidine phosphatase SixA
MHDACQIRVGIALVLLLVSGTSWANDGWDAFRQPGAIAVMRHALAPGTSDPPGFTLGDCATQRNLDQTGREQARAIGRAIRALQVDVDRVLTSEWCRCRETAELLGLGEVEAFPPLNSFFEDRSTRDVQTRQTRDFLAALPDDARIVLVTHQVNITALTGRFASSGETIIIDVAPDGRVEVLGEAAAPF